METDETARIRQLLREHERRLHVLELQAARFGSTCPPEIKNEIDDIHDTIGRIQNELHIREQSNVRKSIKRNDKENAKLQKGNYFIRLFGVDVSAASLLLMLGILLVVIISIPIAKFYINGGSVVRDNEIDNNNPITTVSADTGRNSPISITSLATNSSLQATTASLITVTDLSQTVPALEQTLYPPTLFPSSVSPTSLPIPNPNPTSLPIPNPNPTSLPIPNPNPTATTLSTSSSTPTPPFDPKAILCKSNSDIFPYLRMESDYGSVFPGNEVNFTITLHNSSSVVNVAGIKMIGYFSQDLQLINSLSNTKNQFNFSGEHAILESEELAPCKDLTIIVKTEVQKKIGSEKDITSWVSVAYDGSTSPLSSNVVRVHVYPMTTPGTTPIPTILPSP
jgi:hypothetical protein